MIYSLYYIIRGYIAKNKNDALQKIKEIETGLPKYTFVLKKYSELETQIKSLQENIISSKATFTNGGFVNNGVCLGSEEFKTIIKDLENVIKDIENHIETLVEEQNALIKSIDKYKKYIEEEKMKELREAEAKAKEVQEQID